MSSASQWKYPKARRDDSIADQILRDRPSIPDPYRALEDPDHQDTKRFVDEQNVLTRRVLDHDCPTRSKFVDRMTELYNYPKIGTPFRRGSRYFHYYNEGLQAQSVLYMQESLDSEKRIVIDPNTLSDDGTVALSGSAFSEDGSLMCYGLSKSGSDWITIRVLRIEEGSGDITTLDDSLQYAKFSCMAWTHDHQGFFYNRYPVDETRLDGTETDLNEHHKLYYHRLGTPQSDDLLCYETPEHPKWMSGVEVSDDGAYLLLRISEGCQPANRLFHCRLPSGDKWTADVIASTVAANGLLSFEVLADNFDGEYDYIANDGASFVFHTNLDAPLKRLVRIDLSQADPSESCKGVAQRRGWTELVPESSTAVLEWCAPVRKDRLVLCYLEDVKSALYLHDLATGALIRPLPLPIGTVCGFSGRRTQSELFYKHTGFLSPGVIYRLDLTDETNTPSEHYVTPVKGFDLAEFTTKQVFVTSKDGHTRVPMFLVSRADVALDGRNPTLLYGYGGFNISITPSYSVSRLIFMRHYGGVLAVANIRGGGEYGEDWHQAGIKANKQNVFDDFQACAEWLAEHKYTSPDKLCINGGSNGGLLVGACMNQRPDLYGCAVAQVGVMDMLRFHKFTIGHAWTTDYGCADEADDAEYLIKYSPLHNVRRHETSQYPSTMLFTGDHDDRVVPLHTLKFIATLQHTLVDDPRQTNPLLVRVETDAGHGAGKPTKKVIDEVADMYSFIAYSLKADWID